jgi:hypothetical protein
MPAMEIILVNPTWRKLLMYSEMMAGVLCNKEAAVIDYKKYHTTI